MDLNREETKPAKAFFRFFLAFFAPSRFISHSALENCTEEGDHHKASAHKNIQHMDIVEFLYWLPLVINQVLDRVLPWVVVAICLGLDLRYYRVNVKKAKEKKQDPQDVARQVLILIVVEIAVGLGIWLIPLLFFELTDSKFILYLSRWAVSIFILTYIVYVYGHEYGERRWIYSEIGHIAVVLLGWLVDGWLGVLFISVPVLAAYYVALYRFAMVILPASNFEDKKERQKRFIVLVSYAWGIQFPIQVVSGHAWKKPELRIPGDFTYDLPVPGMIWAKSHQVIGVTGGAQFKRVDGPGVVYTGKLERAFQVVDLRMQLRTNEIDVVSKDGISFKARVFTAFRMDPEPWDNETYVKLRRLNPLLRGANQPSYTDGSFHFSHLRIQAALSTTGAKTTSAEAVIPWDQWALNTIENTTRKIVSQKNLDELWRPPNDQREANALNAIAKEIQEATLLPLRAAGILLVVARIVNFQFPSAEGKTNSIPEQQIATWSSALERRRDETLADAQAESERTQHEARAYAESLLLNSIAEGLQKTQELHPLHPRLPQYVIAMRFLSALQDYVHNRTPEENAANKKKIDALQNYLRNWQNQFFPGEEKGDKQR